MMRSPSLPPLLSAADERELAQTIEAGKAAAERDADGASEPGDNALIERGAAARRRFIEANLRLVYSIANRTARPRHVDVEDLVQDGMIGLDTAVDRFDWRRGFKFSTYATWWIRHSIQRGLESHGLPTRIPSDQQRELRRHRAEDGAGIPSSLAVVDRLQHAASTDGVDAQSGRTLADVLGCSDPTPDDVVERKSIISEVRSALTHLDADARALLTARFGLNGQPPATYADLAAPLGVTPQAARKRIRRILDNLQPQLAASTVS